MERQRAGFGDAPLSGRLSLQAGELRRLLHWLGVVPEDLPEGGFTSLDLTGSVALAPTGFGSRTCRRVSMPRSSKARRS